ncbi:TetR/AcrR family transcriptional regulator [Nocardia brasiliensis]|uniref:TetR/AcrR family transcriptional regulator n=1 Tax=Nocardia brasiliensis TaxID=37326 RepID=UPI0018934FB8|nr:TetR/AcrR family transcriptional regulator [Nocardia brasiliensis]MBF6128663.1 TetR/AcrR family transcriptional regulator [Nocardia brasiliensis]
MTDNSTRPRRRTQEQRRAATVAKLVDATIESLAESGYHHTKVQDVCKAAGMSVGAMFRQFDGRFDLIVAAAQEIVGRQLATFRVLLAGVEDDDAALGMALRYLQQAQSSNLTHALREVIVAARSDAELHARIAPALADFYRQIFAAAEQSGALRRFPAEIREPLFFAMLHTFSGQAVSRPLYSPPGLDDAVLRVVNDMVLAYAASLESQHAR